MQQTTDLRLRSPIMFGDEDTAREYEAEVKRAITRARELGRGYVVAPRLTVQSHDGTLLTAGDEVTVEHFRDRRVQLPGHGVPSFEVHGPERQLRELVARGFVIDVREHWTKT